jgi:hypothetical protein
MKAIKFTIILLLLSSNAYAGNPADLSLFERYYEGGAARILLDSKGKEIQSFRLPHFDGDFSIMLTRVKTQEELEIQTGRLIKRLTPYLDTAIKISNYRLDNTTWTKSWASLDLHGKLFNIPAGIGVHIPFDAEENVKVGPRMSFGDLSTFLTVSEGKDHLAGASYSFGKHKVEVTYGDQDVWFFRTSTLIELSKGKKLFPGLRLKITPEDEVLGLTFLLCF